jgi:curved DNA-binding protein CbpA
MTFVDYYELLQVAPTADTEIINAAYKRLAIKYHPDSGSVNKSEEKMKLLNEARDVLTDSTKRAIYDDRWQDEQDKKTKIKVAKALLDQKKYSEAKAILLGVDHPTARKWIAQIDKKLIEQEQAAERKATGASSARQSAYSPPSQNPSSRYNFDFFEPDFIKPIDPIEQEIRNIKARHDAQRFQEVRRNADEYRRLQLKHEHERVLIGVYQKIGTYAFEWNGYVDNRSTAGIRKVRAWNAIQRKRYEKARVNILELIQWKKADASVQDWFTIINYILENETTSEKFRRLGIRGVADYPVEFAGCTSNAMGCASTIGSFVFLITLYGAASRGDTFAQTCLIGIVALAILWVLVKTV